MPEERLTSTQTPSDDKDAFSQAGAFLSDLVAELPPEIRDAPLEELISTLKPIGEAAYELAFQRLNADGTSSDRSLARASRFGKIVTR